jgi:hypothetical protein
MCIQQYTMAIKLQTRANVLALLLLLIFAKMASAGGDNVDPNLSLTDVDDNDLNTTVPYEWAVDGAWPMSDDDEALSKSYAADVVQELYGYLNDLDTAPVEQGMSHQLSDLYGKLQASGQQQLERCGYVYGLCTAAALLEHQTFSRHNHGLRKPLEGGFPEISLCQLGVGT